MIHLSALRRFKNWTKLSAPIEVFVRHCHYSEVSAHKQRLNAFSKKRCFENLVATSKEGVNLTFFLDTFHPMKGEHFLKTQKKFPVIEIKAGTESGSFLAMLDHVVSQKFSPETLIYFLEDDYLHLEGWPQVLEEGFTLPCADYITLYDHRDKYTDPAYKELHSQIFSTPSCHWRTTPSTTNTYAMRFETLKKHLPFHRAFSQNCRISRDHEKFCRLKEEGAQLLSSIPGWSTHGEPDFASPCTNWEALLV